MVMPDDRGRWQQEKSALSRREQMLVLTLARHPEEPDIVVLMRAIGVEGPHERGRRAVYSAVQNIRRKFGRDAVLMEGYRYRLGGRLRQALDSK